MDKVLNDAHKVAILFFVIRFAEYRFDSLFYQVEQYLELLDQFSPCERTFFLD